MNAIQERKVGELTLQIDRSLCVGFGDCIAQAPTAFALDDDDVVVLTRPESVAVESLLAACAACPMDALSAVDASGRTIYPSNCDASPRRPGDS